MADNVIKKNPETNERGFLVKELGEQAGMEDAGEQPAATFSIDKIVVDPPCWEHGQKPESGHTLLIHLRIATGSGQHVPQMASSLTVPSAYTEIGSNGITHQAQHGSCTDYKKRLQPASFGINQKYRGTVELVVPEASGALVLTPYTLKRGGWEWHY